MKSASQTPEKLDERDSQRRAVEHEAQHVHARRLAGELVADELELVVDRLEVARHLIGMAQAETFLRSLGPPGVLPERPCLIRSVFTLAASRYGCSSQR